MEESTIMNNELTETVAEDIIVEETTGGKVAKAVIGIGLLTVAGVFIYNKLIKPLIAKFKAKKNAKVLKDEEISEDEFNLDGLDLKDDLDD